MDEAGTWHPLKMKIDVAACLVGLGERGDFLRGSRSREQEENTHTSLMFRCMGS